MEKQLRITLAQLNLTVGDLQGNLEKHKKAAIKARDELQADVIIFPELSLTGYPPEDLLLRPDFINASLNALQQLIKEIKGIYCLLGHPNPTEQGLTNACSLIYEGKIIGRYAKQYLPNYSVFDEYRYFTPGNASCVIPIRGIPTALMICEDLWFPDPFAQAKEKGAQLVLVPNASPFETDKHEKRIATLKQRIAEYEIPIAYVNCVGGQDEIVFDGGSMFLTRKEMLCQSENFFKEDLLTTTFHFDAADQLSAQAIHSPSREEKIYEALVLGTRDYINKNHFPGVLIGISGGIDSALTTAIAVDALGKDRVKGILMPSRFTSAMSMEDAHQLIEHLGIASETISIEPAYQVFLTSLAPSFSGKKANITEENIQSRCRAVILMALSNKSGSLVLTTGNRSELATGYCTIYGDMAGGYAVLKDIPKTLVYQLARYRNQIQLIIPERTITRPPTAELAPNQKDEDTLPPYSILDPILEAYLNRSESINDIIRQGFPEEVVIKVVRLLHKNEYKRRQYAIGPRINLKSFGKDWRYPITNQFKG